MTALFRFTGLTIAALALAHLMSPAGARAETSRPFQMETVSEGFDFPWNIAFLPGGDMLVTELSGQLRVIRDGKLVETPIAGVPEVYFAGQGGLFDVMLHPDFAENRTLYLSLAHGTPDANNTRVVKAVYDGKTLSDMEVVFDAAPQKDTPVHYGGRMTFLPDGTFVVTVGDGFDYREEAQRLSSHLGTVVRLNADGTVPAGNPFTDTEGALPEIFSYGHRNAQAILYDPVSDRLYEQEHGAQGGDEINIIEPGLNYGWPVITGGVDYSGAQISPFEEYPGMEQPFVEWTPSIAPAGMAMYRGDLFPDWQGDLLVTALAEKTLRRVILEDGEPAGQEIYLEDMATRLRDVAVAPDGSVYILTDGEGGKVLRLTPNP